MAVGTFETLSAGTHRFVKRLSAIRHSQPMRVLITPDKFKGTLTAQQAAAAIAAGWRRVRPHDHLDLLPMSDGGDGFGEVLAALLGARPFQLAAAIVSTVEEK